MTGALEGSIRATIGQRSSLSEMHVWGRYHSSTTEAAIEATRDSGIASTQDAESSGLRYDEALAADWLDGKRTPDAALLEQLDGKALFEAASVDMLTPPEGRKAPSADQIQRALALGLDLSWA